MKKILESSANGSDAHAKEGGVNSQAAVNSKSDVDGLYAKYVLAMLVVMAIFNFIDRQILSILAEDIKADLGLSDSDLGFLVGTAFSIFYAVFGIPLGRLADGWIRTRQISISVGFWSFMTALSGVARSFFPLALCRFGVGVGEAGATPAAHSLLYDYFSPRYRTTVIGIYSAGVSIGAGIGLVLGGTVLGAWNNAWPDPALAPFGLKGWQASFMIVGLPGLLLSLLLWTLKEPLRGQAEGLTKALTTSPLAVASSSATNPLRTLIMEMLPMLPGVNLWLLRREGGNLKALWLNLGVGFGVVLLAVGLVQLTGDKLQWIALGIGAYCIFSWVQFLICRDPVCFGLIFQCKTVCYLNLFFCLITFSGSAVGFWMIPWFQRYFGVSASEVGTVLGISVAVAGLAGMLSGGLLADRLRRRMQRGKLYVALGSSLFSLLAIIVMLSFDNLVVAYVMATVYVGLGSMGAAPVASTISDLMLPRIRAIAMALFIMTMNLGVALGPYMVGLVSDGFAALGVASGEALGHSMLLSLIVMGGGIIFLLLAIKHITGDENSRLERANTLGEEA